MHTIDDLPFRSPAHIPEININEDLSVFKIEGTSYHADVNLFYQPLIEAIRESSAPKITVSFFLTYFNTATLHSIGQILQLLLAKAKTQQCAACFLWMYDEADIDTYETGKELEEDIDSDLIDFKIIPTDRSFERDL